MPCHLPVEWQMPLSRILEGQDAMMLLFQTNEVTLPVHLLATSG